MPGIIYGHRITSQRLGVALNERLAVEGMVVNGHVILIAYHMVGYHSYMSSVIVVKDSHHSYVYIFL